MISERAKNKKRKDRKVKKLYPGNCSDVGERRQRGEERRCAMKREGELKRGKKRAVVCDGKGWERRGRGVEGSDGKERGERGKRGNEKSTRKGEEKESGMSKGRTKGKGKVGMEGR